MIKENIARVRERISEAARRANRQPEDIRLICVTKSATTPQVAEAIDCGIADIGENRVNEALLKYNQLGDIANRVRWHMIGHLQANKVKNAIGIFDVIHSLDSLKLANEIEKRAASSGRKIDCLVEVNTSGELSKYGLKEEELIPFVGKASDLAHINIIGLMTMAPIVKNAELARPYFIKLRHLKEKLQAEDIPNTDIRELSMGMSQDYEVAVEEGATTVRIGTAIFG